MSRGDKWTIAFFVVAIVTMSIWWIHPLWPLPAAACAFSVGWLRRDVDARKGRGS